MLATEGRGSRRARPSISSTISFGKMRVPASGRIGRAGPAGPSARSRAGQRRAVRIGRPAPAATLDGGGAGAAGPCGGRRPPCPAPSSGPSVMMVFPSARGSLRVTSPRQAPWNRERANMSRAAGRLLSHGIGAPRPSKSLSMTTGDLDHRAHDNWGWSHQGNNCAAPPAVHRGGRADGSQDQIDLQPAPAFR